MENVVYTSRKKRTLIDYFIAHIHQPYLRIFMRFGGKNQIKPLLAATIVVAIEIVEA